MMFSNGKWNCVLLPGTSGKRTVRAVRADGKEMQRWESPLRAPVDEPEPDQVVRRSA